MSNQTYDHSVFINCPFDAQYVPLFQAVLFAVVDCGFLPRTALDVEDSSEVRIHKIYTTIGECRLSIHELSRTQLDENSGLPRFNMPLELGIFLGAKFLGDESQRRKACLVFDEKPYRYQTYLSDVAGQDIRWHSNDPRTIIIRVRDWLASLSGDQLPSGSIVWDHYLTFRGELRHNCERLKQKTDELTHRDYLHHVGSFRQSNTETLQVGTKRAKKNPKLEEIKRAIRDLSPSNDSFLILGKGANGHTYMQAFLNEDGGWDLEYQDGHLEQHYAVKGGANMESVIRAFLSYARCEDSWKTEFDWQQVDL